MYEHSKEYLQMVFSYMQVLYGIGHAETTIYEDDSGIEMEEMEDRTLTLREEALKNAPLMKEIYHLLRRGSSKWLLII